MLLVVVVLVVFAADRLTKLAVQRYMPVGTSRPLIDNLVFLTHTQNTGAAFSFGHGLSGLFLLFALVVGVVIVVVYTRVPRDQLLMRIALGMVLGGALGNAFDRLVFQSVTDFIDVRWWPVFNVADSCIVVATLVLVLVMSRRQVAAVTEGKGDVGESG
jgi:signal peptidase II